MTIVNLRGQKLDLVSKCCVSDIKVKNKIVHIYICKNCGKECAVYVSEKDTWSKDDM